MVSRANHMENLVLPDYFVRVPTITYTDVFGHKTKLRQDLTEDSGEEEYVYCRQCDVYYLLEDMEVHFPLASGGKPGSKMRGGGISRKQDDAIVKDRIVKMLVVGGLTQEQVATRLGISQQRVSQVAAEVSNILRSRLVDSDSLDTEEQI